MSRFSFKRTLSTAFVASLALAGSLTSSVTSAEAGWGGHHRYGAYHGRGGYYGHRGSYGHRGYYGGALAAGAIGALAVGALAASSTGPYYGYSDGGDCYPVRRRFWSPEYGGYVVRRVTVCE